jgi:membrane protease YdiL (CAAX protease family)
MNPLSRLVVILFVSLLAAAVLSPWAYLGVQWMAAHWDGSLWDYLARHPFTRYFNRVFQIGLAIGIIMEIVREVRKGHGIPFERLGLKGSAAADRFVAGAVSSLLIMTVYALLAGALHWQGWRPGIVAGDECRRAVTILLMAIGVAVGEEIFFRGYFYSLCREQLGRASAIGINILFFASIHAIRPVAGFTIGPVDWKSGFTICFRLVSQFAEPNLLGGILVLAVVAAFLCWTVERTGSIHLAIGLHAGWIVTLKENFAFTCPAVDWPIWVLGGGDLSQGILALVPVGVQFLLVRWWLNRRQGQSS